jgi:TonB family protein
MRLCCGLFAFVCAALLLATPARAAKNECPRTLLLESTNGAYYVGLFGAPAQMTAAFDLTLYTKAAAYTVSVVAGALSKPAGVPQAAFRGAPVVIKNPAADPFLGATVQPTIARSALHCDSENIIIPSIESLTASDRHVEAHVAALEDQVATEMPSSGPPLVPVAAATIKPLTCDTPFADASVDHVDTPAFPDAARQAGAFGTVSVRVFLNQAGAVTSATIEQTSGSPVLDDAALASARKTTFHPARFLCEAQRSSHVLDYDFSK